MDNDLLARRLRPPSEPPRPHNGHSPLPADMPAWATSPNGANVEASTEIPWDRPVDEPWPPAPTDEAPDADVWPPKPARATASAPVAEPAVTEAASADDETADAYDERAFDDDAVIAMPGPEATAQDPDDPGSVFNQTIWESTPAPWDAPDDADEPGSVPWDAPSTWTTSKVPTAHAEPAPWDMPRDGGLAQAGEAAEVDVEESAAPIEVEAEVDADGDSGNMTEETADSTDEATDISVAGGAPWDTPAPYLMFDDDDDAADDRPSETLESYDDMAPVVTRAVAAAAVTQAINDPDDSMAPVLHDVDQPATPEWQWNAKQPEFMGKVVGPTPPADLFVEPPAEEAPWESAEDAAEEEEDEAAVAEAENEGYGPDTLDFSADKNVVAEDGEAAEDAEVVDDAAVAEDAEQTETEESQPAAPEPSSTTIVTTAVPNFYSTAPSTSQQPMVLRIEVAIVDGKIQPLDVARQVGPWSDAADADSVTVRHPDFEPRTQGASPEEDEPVVDEPETAHAEASAWTSLATKPVDVPWALPPLDASPDAQSEPVAPPDPEPVAPPEPQPDPLSTLELSLPPANTQTQVDYDPWATPAPPWLDEHPVDELAPVPDPVADVRASAPARAAVAASVAQQAASTAPTQASAARSATANDQSDLWFLASEPEVDTAEETTPGKSQPSTMLTAGLTIAMAIVVIVLVVVFISLMTSLLR